MDCHSTPSREQAQRGNDNQIKWIMHDFISRDGLGRKRAWWLLLVVLVVGLAACAAQAVNEAPSEPSPVPVTAPAPAAPAPAAAGELTVDVGMAMGTINPLVYGANYGPWSGVPVEALDELEQSGLNLLRFPGGNWGDNDVVRANHVDLLKIYRDLIDAKLTVSVNLREGTLEQAVELMQMFDDKDMDVAFWSIGNEPNLFAARNNEEHWNTEYYNARWREFAVAMKAYDPGIKLVGPNLSQFTAYETQNPKDEAGRDWMREFLKANGDMVDNISFHRYPFGGSPSIEEVRPTSEEWDATIPYLREIISEETGRDIPVSIMEVNTNWSHAQGGEGTPDSHFNAIWWADSLGRIINQDVDMVAFFTLSHNDGTSLLGRSEMRPTFFVYKLYQQFGSEKLFADSGVENVSVFAAQRQDGAVTLIVVNRGDEAVSVPLNMANYAGGDTAELHRFDVEHQAENMGDVAITDLDLPGQSISLYILPGAQE